MNEYSWGSSEAYENQSTLASFPRLHKRVVREKTKLSLLQNSCLNRRTERRETEPIKFISFMEIHYHKFSH